MNNLTVLSHRYFNNSDPFTWRIDEDGHLRITMCIMKEGVYEYGIEEVPDVPELAHLSVVKEYIPLEALKDTEAHKTLEGKDIVIDAHEWRTPDNSYTDGYSVGSIAGTPYVSGDELLCDAIVKDPKVIELITSEELPEEQRLYEVSAGYDGGLIVEEGEFKGQKYNAKQTNFRFNHVLLLPRGRGRLGPEVRIVNSNPQEDLRMAGESKNILKVRIGNSDRTFRFTNEEDQREAETMIEEERKFNAEQVAASLAEKEKLSAQIEELKAQLAEHDAHLKEAQGALEEALSEETQELLAAEMAEQADDEDALVQAETDEMVEDGEIENEEQEEKKEEILNSVRKANGKRNPLSVRRKNMVRRIMENRGMSVPENWDEGHYDASFETLVVEARIKNKRREKATVSQRALNGKQTAGNLTPMGGSARERFLNAFNKKEKK